MEGERVVVGGAQPGLCWILPCGVSLVVARKSHVSVWHLLFPVISVHSLLHVLAVWLQLWDYRRDF